MRYLFWNTHNKNVDSIVCELVKKYTPTVLTLAEYNGNIEQLVGNIQQSSNLKYKVVDRFACRVQILINIKLYDKVEHCHDHKNYTIKMLPYNNYKDNHIVAFVHLPSKMNNNREKNRYLLEKITSQINDLSIETDRKVVIVGDFNLNPYDDAMTQLTGCNAVSSRNVALKIGRKHWIEKEKQFLYYYNPMWNFLGDSNNVCGTYYYDKTTDHSRYWNTFDQFLVSPHLIKDIKEIEIVTNVGNIDLTDKNGVPNVKFSDHYPLYFKLGGK